MGLVVASDSIAEFLVVKAGGQRFVLVVGILLFGFFAFREGCGSAREGDGVEGVAVGDGGVVYLGDEAVVELLLLFRLRAVLAVIVLQNPEELE